MDKVQGAVLQPRSLDRAGPCVLSVVLNEAFSSHSTLGDGGSTQFKACAWPAGLWVCCFIIRRSRSTR